MRDIVTEDSTLIGLFMLTAAVIVLFSSPEAIFSNVSIVDTNLYHKTQNEIYIISTFDFYDIVSITLGTVAAYFVLLKTMGRTDE